MNHSEPKATTVLWASLLGAGAALSQMGLSAGCSVPAEGRCNVCGGCLVALAVLAGLALTQKGRVPPVDGGP